MACRTGCITKDHSSYADCLRAGLPRVAYCNSAEGRDLSRQKAWDRELDFYRDTVAQGIQPASTKTKDIEAAVRASDKTGQAFRADV